MTANIIANFIRENGVEPIDKKRLILEREAGKLADSAKHLSNIEYGIRNAHNHDNICLKEEVEAYFALRKIYLLREGLVMSDEEAIMWNKLIKLEIDED